MLIISKLYSNQLKPKNFLSMETKCKRYCDINSCVNKNGTKSREFDFFRVSQKDIERKKKWVAVIEKHQSIDENVKSLSICSLHFLKNDFSSAGCLKKDRLPTIFEISSVDDESENISKHCSHEQSRMPNSALQTTIIDANTNNLIEYLERKNLDLQKELFEKERALYKANDQIMQLEYKLDEKIKKYTSVYHQYHYYRKEYEKLKSETDSSQNNDVEQIVKSLNGESRLRYSKAVRRFALTIDYYSPKAYRYIRETFNRNLPHPSTLKKYYVNSGANGEPGISTESMECLRLIVNDFQMAGKRFLCALTFDEVFIRPHVQYIDAQKKFQGFITYGEREGDDLPVANAAIVFMINGLNKPISLPVAHHFVTSLKKEEKANLLENVISAISETGAVIVNITCDGLAANLAMFQFLGASFSTDNMRPYILNSVTGNKIYTMLDACHMLKLVRNCLMNRRILYDGNNLAIKWEHYERLETIRGSKGFVQHKLTKKHIECQRNKMNVKLAAQTLSRSVANAMKFLMEAEKSHFQDCAGTIKFTQLFNDLFDILNTGFEEKLENNGNNKFKVPICPETADCVFPFMDHAVDFIKSLKLNGASILKTALKTGFLGFIIDIVAVKLIYAEYVETGQLVALPTFNQSQDPLESFFGRVRSKCGYNTNPTVEQFKSAYRKILINNEIKASVYANCIDNLNIYFVSSAQHSDSARHDEQSAEQEHINEIEEFTPNDNLFDVYEEATICKIASDIEKTIRNQAIFECNLCLNILNENEKVSIEILEKQCAPCVSTVYLCKVSKKYFNISQKNIRFDYNNLIETIHKKVDYDNVFKKSDFGDHEDHKRYFIEYMIKEYIRIQATYIAKHLTLKEHNKLQQNLLNKNRDNLRNL